MKNDSQGRADSLLQEYASKHSSDAAKTDDLLSIEDPDQLFGMLASRVTLPDAMFGSPADRYGTRINEGELTRSAPMIELGKRVFARCSAALHDFLCKPGDQDKQLRDNLIKALVGREVGATSVIAGGLVVLLGMTPAASAIVAAILVQVLVIPTANVLCEQWDSQIAGVLGGKKTGDSAQ
jgi:hypothetical protein